MHRAHTFVAARVPSTVAAEEEGIWRRAIGRAQTFERAEETLRDRSNRDDYRTEPISGTTATFFGHSTAVTHRMEPAEWVYNVRSYWSEAVLFGLIQQSYLEFYAQELGRLGGDPLGEPVNTLFLDWVAFRNVLWWKRDCRTPPICRVGYWPRCTGSFGLSPCSRSWSVRLGRTSKHAAINWKTRSAGRYGDYTVTARRLRW